MRNLLFAVCLWGASMASWAQSNLALFISPSGEYIGQGTLNYTTNLSDYTVGPYTGGVQPGISVSAFGYSLVMAGPNQTLPTVGVYSNATRFPFNGSSPGLSVSSFGRGCNSVCGSFQIFELHRDGSGNIDRFWAIFSQKCECGGPPLTGEIRYHSLLAPAMPWPRTLRVPEDFATIQSALNAVNVLTLDTVLVDPGVYHEAVQFSNLRAQLVAANGPTQTYLVATNGTVLSFGGAPPDALVTGFTLIGADTGISVGDGGSPTIVSNAIVNCGTGINCGARGGNVGSTTIRSNTITGCVGGAIQLSFTARPVVEGNRLEDNGSGIGMWQAGNPLIRNNVIRRNHGDGMGMANVSNADIVQNLIVENDGNGVSWLAPLDARGPWLVNNTIVGNRGAGIASSSYSAGAEILNNIVVGDPALAVGGYAVPLIAFNDVFSPSGSAYSGIGDLTGQNGNISVNPMFVCQPGGDFRLLTNSPCIDAATNGADLLPPTDFSGGPRIVAGSSGGSAVADMGIFESNPATPPPAPCLFLYCPANVTVFAAPGQSSAPASFPAPFATPGATVTSSPPSGSVFPAGTNTVNCTATYGTNVLRCAFTVTVVVPPTITRQPLSQSVPAGTPTNLSVSVSGSAPLSYQWRLEGKPLPAGTNAVYLLPGPQSADEGDYQVVITNVAGAVTSSPALLRVVPAVAGIRQGPAPVTVSAGSNATFSVIATGSTPLWYQWCSDSGPIAGATAAQLTIRNAQAANSGNYWCTVSNLLGVATSAPAALNVVAAKPAFIQQPASLMVPLGTNCALSCVVSGSEPLAYQWRLNNTSLPGATQSTLTFSNVSQSNNGLYAVVVTNSLGAVTSQPASLYVTGSRPTFTQQPVSTEVLQGSTVTLNSLATGSSPLSYQWCFYGTNLPGRTNRQLVLSSVSLANSGPYYVVATNAFGATNSVTAQLTVNQSLVLVQALTNQVVDVGSTVLLAVEASSTNPLSYSWSFNGRAIPGTNTALVLTNVQPGQSGYYRVTVANPYGSLSSSGRVSVLGVPGAVVAWGDDSGNQADIPAGLNDAVATAGGDYHSLALRRNGSLLAWGFNADGQTNAPVSPLRAVAIAAGAAHNLAVLEDGSVIAWGRNDAGQCNVPAAAVSVVTVGAGEAHSLALLGSGSVVAWGDNSSGQCNVPAGLNGVQSIAAGRGHSLALRADGSVVGWGLNTSGQAVSPPGLSSVAAIAAGYLHSVALLTNGTVVAWGDNAYGQTNVPPSATNIVAIAAGDLHTVALRADGTVLGWGNDWFGQATVPSLAQNAAGITCGYYHSLALSPTPRLLASPTLNGLLIQWSGPGKLQWAPTPLGPYQDIPGAAQSYTNTELTAPAKFFRVRR